MPRIILSFITAAVCILSADAQTDSVTAKLLSLEQRIFLSSNAVERNALLLEKLNVYISGGVIDEEALAHVKRIDASLISEVKQRITLLHNAALIAHINNDHGSAGTFFNSYLQNKADTSVNDAILGALVFQDYDTAKVSSFSKFAASKDTSLSCVQCLNDAAKYKKKGKDFIVFSSYLIPGSGSIMTGHVLKGAVSLIIFASTGFGVYLLAANELYFNAALFAAPWFLKFYGGQIRLTKKLFGEKERKKKNRKARNCAERTEKVLMQYPIDFIR